MVVSTKPVELNKIHTEYNNLIAVRKCVRNRLQQSKGDTTNNEQLTKVELALNKFLENKQHTLHQKQLILNSIQRIKTHSNDERKFKQDILCKVNKSFKQLGDIYNNLENINDNVIANADEIRWTGVDIRKNGQQNRTMHQHTQNKIDKLQTDVNVGNGIALISTTVTLCTAIVKTVGFIARVGPAALAFGMSFIV